MHFNCLFNYLNYELNFITFQTNFNFNFNINFIATSWEIINTNRIILNSIIYFTAQKSCGIPYYIIIEHLRVIKTIIEHFNLFITAQVLYLPNKALTSVSFILYLVAKYLYQYRIYYLDHTRVIIFYCSY